MTHSANLAVHFEQSVKSSGGAFVLSHPRSFVNVCFWWVPPALRPFNPATASQQDLDVLGKVTFAYTAINHESVALPVLRHQEWQVSVNSMMLQCLDSQSRQHHYSLSGENVMGFSTYNLARKCVLIASLQHATCKAGIVFLKHHVHF